MYSQAQNSKQRLGEELFMSISTTAQNENGKRYQMKQWLGQYQIICEPSC